MSATNRACVACTLLLLTVPWRQAAASDTSDARYRIGSDAVRTAILNFAKARGWDETIVSGRLDFPEIFSIRPDLSVQVAGVGWNRGHDALQLRLGCAEKACPGFVAYLSLPPSSENGNLIAMSSSKRRTMPAAAHVWVAKAKPATLLLENGGMRLSVPVTCIDEGGLGDHIRVRDRSTGHVLTGVVIGSQLIEGEL